MSDDDGATDTVEEEDTTPEDRAETEGEGTEPEPNEGEEPEPEEEGEPEVPDALEDLDDETAAAVEAHIEELESTVSEQANEIDELQSKLKRKQADFQNYKKRAKKRQEQMRERATEELVERLLDVRDNLARALESEGDDAESLREGVKMTLNEFDRVLDAEGVVAVEPEPGEEVDPQRHEVMLRVESDQPEGTIAEVYAPGYEMGDRTLRPAQVTVSEGGGDDYAENEESGDEE